MSWTVSGRTPARSRYFSARRPRRDGFLFESDEKITAEALKRSTARLFAPDTILMAIYGSPTVGRLGILTSASSCNQAALGMVPDNRLLTRNYLHFTLLFLREQFNRMAQGAAQQNISKEKVAATLMVLPPRELVQRFDEVVGPVMSQALTLMRQVNNLTETRNLLLPRLTAGRIEVAGDSLT